MNFLKKILWILLVILPISNSFGAMVTEVQNITVGDSDGTSKSINGVQFNNDGTKMFVIYQQNDDNGNGPRFVEEFNLSTTFDISTATYAGNSERCELDDGSGATDGTFRRIFDLQFTNDGLSFFYAVGNAGSNTLDHQTIFRFDLTSPFDISTCSIASDTVDLNSNALQNGSNAGDHDGVKKNNRAQGVEINDDGTKLFVLMADAADSGDAPDRILEYNFSTPFDLSTLSLVTSAGIELPNATVANAMSLKFSANGKRLFVLSHNTNFVAAQISLDSPYDTSSFNIDGSVDLNGLSNLDQLRSITFSKNGLKMYIGNDKSDGSFSVDKIFEFNLVCPFNIIAGKCPSITENSNETGVAEAQIELARKTIEYSTKTALNRLKWIRRNKDKQNLTNQNIKFNFSNQMLASLTEALKVSTLKNKENKKQDVFYWSEGSISMGRVGDTNISLSKEIKTNSITFGADKFIDNNAIQGVAFRYGKDEVDVGSEGSNVDMDAYNVMLYYSVPKTETKYLDTIIGVGRLRTDITTAYDGKKSAGDRFGTQLYGTVKIKDEIKKDNLTLIPSGQIDLGYTLLNSYIESGPSAKNFDKQGIQSKNVKLAIAAVDKLLTEKYTLKRHGKLEYKADLHRSSSLKYSYVSDGTKIDTKLQTGALHNINGEIGFDLIFSDNYSVFVIYERSHAFGSGYTDQIHIALGYLPYKDTEYTFLLTGSENLVSQFKINKKINGYDISFNLNDDLSNLGNNREASINLNKVF